MCVCVCVCVCVRERERSPELNQLTRETRSEALITEWTVVSVCVCACERERERECVCVCVAEPDSTKCDMFLGQHLC